MRERRDWKEVKREHRKDSKVCHGAASKGTKCRDQNNISVSNGDI